MQKHPFFSVIIPVYNSEKYLNSCIASIVAQTFDDYEIILLPGHSTDNSTALCYSFANNNSKIKIVEQDIDSPAYARNKGIKYANGEYICFVDSDDILICDALKVAYSTIASTDADLIEFGFYQASENLDDCIAHTNSKFINMFDHSFYERFAAPAVWKLIIKKDLWTKHQLHFPNRIHGEDLAVYSLLFSISKNNTYINQPLYIYRLHAGSITDTNKNTTVDPVASLVDLYDFAISESKRLGTYKTSLLTLISQMEHHALIAINAQPRDFHNSLKERFAINIKNKFCIPKCLFDICAFGWGSVTSGTICQMISQGVNGKSDYIKDMSFSELLNDELLKQFISLISNNLNINTVVIDLIPEAEVISLSSPTLSVAFNSFQKGFSLFYSAISSIFNSHISIILLERYLNTKQMEDGLLYAYDNQEILVILNNYMKVLYNHIKTAYPKIYTISAPPEAANYSINTDSKSCNEIMSTYYYENIMDYIHKF